MNLLTKLEKKREVWYLLIISCVFFLLRLPSLFEPYWYGDEGIYQAMGDAMNSGRLLYVDVWDNKPPLLYMLYAFFHSDQFTIRLISLIVGLCSVFIFFFLSRKLFTKYLPSVIATTAFAILFALPITEGNIANAENFILLPIIAAVYYIRKLLTQEKEDWIRKLFLPGILCGIAFLFKIVAIFDFSSLLVILFFVFMPQKFSAKTLISTVFSYIQSIRLFLFGFITPLAIASGYFIFKGAFLPFFQASFLGNIGYVGYNNTFIIPQGLLILKLLLLTLALVIIFIFKKKLPLSLLVILTWLSFSLFNVFFAQRPYPHYLLVLLPSLILLVGSIFEYQQWQKYLESLVLTCITFVIVIFHINLYRNPMFYYINFLSFISGNKTIIEYRSYFDRNVNKNYLITDYLKTHTAPGDIIYLWGNSAQIYHLSKTLPPGKYVVAYHIASTLAKHEMEIAIERTRPRFIIVTPDESSYPFPLEGYTYKMTIVDSQVYEKIY